MKNEIFTSMYEQTQPKRAVIKELIRRAENGDEPAETIDRKPKVLAAAAAAVLVVSGGVLLTLMQTTQLSAEENSTVKQVTAQSSSYPAVSSEAEITPVTEQTSAAPDEIPDDTSAVSEPPEPAETSVSSEAGDSSFSSSETSGEADSSSQEPEAVQVETEIAVEIPQEESEQPGEPESSSPEPEPPRVDTALSFVKVDEMAERLIAGRNSDEYRQFFEHETQAAHPGHFTFYSPALNDEVTIRSVWLSGNFLHIYFDTPDGSQCEFTWGILTEGEVYLKNCAKMFGLDMIEGHDGWYGYIEDEQVSIYWAEDGYYFDFIMPRQLFDECGIALVRTDYQIN